jgi:hypothetical protein
MTQCITQLSLGFLGQRPVVIDFDAPELSSDGGAVLLRQVDDQLGVSAGLAAMVADRRNPALVIHDLQEQVRQRVFGIALGYEDCNDAERLRHDPLLKTVCGRLPDDRRGLSSQPTLSRFENAVDWASIRRLTNWFEATYVAMLPDDTTQVILDIDSTEDETHGGQQLSFFNAHYDHYMYHPLLLFDGSTSQLISARLRPGSAHASRGAAGLLARVIRQIKRRFPQAHVVVRADGGFCVPRVLRVLEQLDHDLGDVDYLLSIPKNKALLRLAEPVMAAAQQIYQAQRHTVRSFTDFRYAARSWNRPRLVVTKAEHNALGGNPRFVVTSLEGFPPEMIYSAYCERGQSENMIKDLKNALDADRLSCCTFKANSFRLLLHCAAYRLMHRLRQVSAEQSEALGRAQFDTLRLRILKVGALVKQSARRIHLRLPRAFPLAAVFRAIAASLEPPPAPA